MHGIELNPEVIKDTDDHDNLDDPDDPVELDDTDDPDDPDDTDDPDENVGKLIIVEEWMNMDNK